MSHCRRGVARAPRLGSAGAFVVLLAGHVSAAEEWRYSLVAGDHLVFRGSLERESSSPDTRAATRLSWTSHVLVLSVRDGLAVVGAQRNRDAGELTRYSEGGHDRLAAERPGFAEELDRSGHSFAEANRVTSRGERRMPWSVVREATSELLPSIHEMPPLPPGRAQGSWKEPTLFGLSLAADVEGGCLRIRGADDRIKIDYLVCDGALKILDLEANYDTPVNRSIRERLRIELLGRSRGETPLRWLDAADTAEGVAAAMMVADLLPVAATELHERLGRSARVDAAILAVSHRFRAPAPPTDALLELWDRAAPRVRALAVRRLETASEREARPVILRALGDPEASVSTAAREWLRARSPLLAAQPSLLESDWARIPNQPLADAEAAALALIAQAAWGVGPLPEWSCAVTDRAPRALDVRRAPPQVPGTTLRTMRTAPFAGRPYVLHVPDDYRGDRAYPLLVVLAGGPGRAVPMAQGLRAILASLDAVVLMPDALGEMWWAEGPTAAFLVLLHEVMGDIDLDPNRVFLTGFSNGGTGTFLFATLWPDRFAAAVSQMGGGLALFSEDPPRVANLTRLPFLFLHGDHDPIIPKSASEDTAKAIRRQASDAPVSIEIVTGHGHDLTLASDEGRSLRFLLNKTRPVFPRRLVFETRTDISARRDWIEITKRQNGVAGVKAEIGDDDVVRLTTRRVTKLRLLLRRELFSGKGPIAVDVDGRRLFEGPLVEDCQTYLESWRKTADPFLAYGMELNLDLQR